MKPIIRWNLWERKGSMLGWSVGIGIYIALNILVYSTVRGQAQAFNHVLSSLPPTAKALFSDNSNLLSPVGYLSGKLYYLILPLLFSLLAINLSTSLLTREEQDGTLELLLSRPISRGKLLLAKLVSGVIVMIVVGGVALVVTFLCVQRINYGIADIRLLQATLLTLLLSLLFGAVAWLLIGVGGFGKRASIGGAAFVALGSYLVSSLENTASWLQTPAKLLPYHYYQPSAVLQGTYNWWNAAVLVVATITLLVISYLGFRRRDID